MKKTQKQNVDFQELNGTELKAVSGGTHDYGCNTGPNSGGREETCTEPE